MGAGGLRHVAKCQKGVLVGPGGLKTGAAGLRHVAKYQKEVLVA